MSSGMARIRCGIIITNSLKLQKVSSLSIASIILYHTVSLAICSTEYLLKKRFKGYLIIDRRKSLKS